MRRRLLLAIGTVALVLGVAALAFSTRDLAAGAGNPTATAVAIPTQPLPATISPRPGQNCTPGAKTIATTTPSDGSCGYRLPTSAAQTANFSQGVPAIKPRTAVTDPTTPTFADTDVTQYVATHLPQGRISAQGTVTVASVQFKPLDQTNAQLHTDLAIPTNTLLCVAELKGNFVLTGPPHVNADGTYSVRTTTLQTVYYIFDAHTGNLVETVGAP